MKNNAILISFFAFLFLIFSCSDDYKFTLETPKKTTFKETIKVTLKEKNDKTIKNVQFFVNGKEVSSKGNSISINTTQLGVGKHAISALAFFEGGSKKINSSFEVFANKKPIIYTYKILNTYPHDTHAFTQGLEYYNGFLYETTGQRGESTLRKVQIKTGKILKKVDLDKKYFGEGMTIVNGKIVWLTWQNKKGFVYNLETFKQEKEFAYNKSKEGWGLTHNNNELIKSDGTNKIWFLDKENQQEKHHIQVYTHDRALNELNELELINGKLYANYWQKPLIAIINPNNGVVEGIADLRGLKAEMKKTQKLKPQSDVLNGIAFDKENNRLFVTGKNWGKLFEIELIKK